MNMSHTETRFAWNLLVIIITMSLNFQTSTASAQDEISPARQKAQKLFQAITAVRVPIDDPRVLQMEALVKTGDLKGAAAIATADPLFLDQQVRDVARQMSDRDETVRAPLTDFVATFVGVVRDSDTTSAKELLTGNFYYRGDPALTANPPIRAPATTAVPLRGDEEADIVRSNNHYTDLNASGLSLKEALVRKDGQRLAIGTNGNTGTAANPDPAGILTSRGFLAAHAVAGTNRRLVEYAFREFMCVSMDEWSDGSTPDDRVGRDVTRTPGGSLATYQATCKACHGQMDGFRGAFALVDFNNNRVSFSTNPVNKMNRNASEAPLGFPTTDNSFINYATGPKNSDLFGWRSGTSGKGIFDFGKMLADSRGFSRCMVKRAFKAVCRRKPIASETGLVRTLADQFESDGYHMRRMFENVAIQPQCIN